MMDIQEDIISIKEKIIKTDNILHKFVDVKAKYDILMKKYKWSVKELDTLKLEHDAKIYLNEMLSREIEQLKTNNSKLSGDYNSLKSSHDYDLDQLVNLQIKYQSTCKGNCENFKEKLEPLESEEKRVKKRKSRKYDFVDHFADENVKPTNSTEIESDRNEKMVTNSTDSRSNSIKIEILADENAAEQSDSNNFEVKLEEDLFNEVNKNLLSELKKAQEEKTICIETSRAKELSMYREWQEKETTWKKNIKDLEENIEQEKKSINKHWQGKEIQMKKKLEKMEQKLKKQMEDIKERIQKEKSILTSNFESKIYDMKTEWKKKEEELNKEIVRLKEKIQREKSISENFKQNEKDITLRWREEEQRWKIKISNLEKKLLSLEKNDKQVQNRVLNHEHNNVNESHDNQDEISDKEHTEDESDDIFNMMRGLRLAMISPIPELSMEHEHLTNEDETVLPEHQQNGTVFKNTNEQEQQSSEILDRSDWRDRYQANRKKKRVKYQKLSVIKKAKQKFWLQLSQAFTSNVKIKSQPIRQKENMHVRKNSPLINLSESSAGSSNTLINGIADLMSKKLHPSKARTRSTKDMNILEVNKMLLEKAKQENETKSLYKKESLHKDLELSSDDEDDSALRQDKGSANLKEQDSSNAGNASFRSPYDSHISGIDTPTFVDSCYESISNPLSIESSVIDNLCEDNKGNNQLEQEDNMISEMKESVETDRFKAKVNQCTSLKLAHKHSQDIQVENIEKLIVDKDKTEELIKKINTPEKVQSCENQMSTNNFEIEYNVNNLETTQTENIKLELKKEFNSLPQDEEKDINLFKSSNFTLDEFNEKSEILERSNEKLDNSPKLSGGNDEIKEFYQEQTEECIMEENGNNNSKELNNMLDVNCDQDNIAEKGTEKNADSEIVHSENQTKEEQLDHEKVKNEDLKIEYDKNSNNFTEYQEIFEMIKEESFENLNLNKNQVMKCYSGNVNKNKYIDRNICQENENNFNSKIYKEEKFEYKAPTLFSNDSSIQLKEEQENNSTGYNSDTEEESSCESNDDSITESDIFNQSLLSPNSSEEEEDIMEICNEIMNGNLNSQSKENTLTNMKHYPTPINHPTTSSAAHSIATGFKNLLAIAAATDIGFKEAATIKEYLKDLNEFLTVDATADTYTLITSEERIESDFFPNLFDSETESLCSMSFENDDYLEDGREKSVKYRVLDEPVKEEKNRSNVRIWSMFSKNNREELRMSKSFCHEDEYNKSSVAIIDNVCNKVRDTTADKTKEKSILGAGNLISEKSDDKKNDVPITSKDTICFESKPYDDNAKCFNIIKNSSDNIKEKKTELTFNNKKLDDKISSESEPNDENKKYINILKNSNEERKTELTCTEKKPEDTVLVESERFEENAKCINIVKNEDDITELPSTKNKSEYTISSESESYDENVKCINIVANAYGNITGKKSDLSSTKKKLEDTIYFESKPNDENAKCINIVKNKDDITELPSTKNKSEDTISSESESYDENVKCINIVANAYGNITGKKSDLSSTKKKSEDTIYFESKPNDKNAKCIVKNSNDNITEKKTELTFSNKKLDDEISSESEPNDENEKYINILKNSNEERKTELTCTEKKPEDTVLVECEPFEENAKCINIVKNEDDITELPSTKNKSEDTISSESESYDENVKCINIVANAYGNITGKKSDLSSTKKKSEDTIYFESKPNDENAKCIVKNSNDNITAKETELIPTEKTTENTIGFESEPFDESAKCINIVENLNGNITGKKTEQSSTEKKSEDTIDFEYKPEAYANCINIVKNSNDITELTSSENKLQDVNEHNPSILENLSPLNNTMECSYKSEQKFSQNTCNLLNLEVPSKPQKRKRGQKSALMTKSIRVYNLRNSATRVNRNNEMKANNSSQSKTNDATFEENSSNSTNSPSKAKRRKLSPLLRETRTLSKNSVGGKLSEQDIFGSPLSPCISDDESPLQIENLNSFIPSTSTPVEKRTKRKRSTQSPSKIENFSKPCTSPIVENEIKRRSSTISPSKMQILNFSIPSTSPSVGNKSKRRRSTQSPSKVEIFNFSIPSTSPSEGNKSKRRRSTQSPSKMEILNFSIPSTSPLEENKSKRRRSTQSPSKVENSNLWKPSTSLPEEKKSKRRRNPQSPSNLENSNIINRSKSTPVKKQVKMRKSINSSNNLESSILMNQHTKNSESPAVTSNLINNVNQNSSQNEVVPCTKNKAKIKIIQDIILKSKSNEQKLGGFKRPMRTKILPACPQSPPLPKEDTTGNHQPIIIPLDKPEKLDPSKAASLFRQLITYSTEEKTTEEVARHFCNQEADYISRLIMQQIIQDKEKADAVVTHAPLMTHTQRVMLGFMLKLEKMNVYNLISTYLKVSEFYLIRTTELETIESLTRMNVAICKSHGYIERMRKFCLEAFYFMGDLAIPFLFIVLTSWIEVLPPAKDSKDFPLVKVLVQLINLKTCNIPGYNLLSLRDLLNKFYEYPREPWNSDNFFKEIFTNYLKKPEAPADFTILLYTKNCECKWVCQKINDLIKPILEKVKNVNFKATIIVLIGHIMNPFIGKSHSEHVESIRKWLKEQVSDETPEIVRKSIVYSLKKFPKANKKVVNKNEKKDIVQTVNM
ncbi:putative uncharacterized protein DDB_G0282133 isoform X2 [Harmonia axyridis]|uniref:putative uncharacterized protein DDB_G0282133 isoform X2 n=1 Tax=Harmonia axyridis TaxID=115357 RepID=UPI001E27605B|nr:putative uncharacterized protein DDB_G0282133 isoform X2 [Harmonia axyridis]